MEKILFINHSLSNGGSERVMTLLANELSIRGYDVEMLIQDNSNSETYKLNNNIKRYYFESENLSGKRYVIKWLAEIRKTIKNGRYDSVISFMMANNVLTILANWGLKSQVIVSERCDPRRVEDYGRVFKYGEQFLYPFAKTVVVQTPDVKEYYKNSIRKKSVVIPNPVNSDLKECTLDEKKRKVFVTAGRLCEQKNYPMLIRAFALFCRKIDGYELEIYGQGPLRHSLEVLCQKLEIADRVKFKGYVDDVNDYMRSAAAVVMASNYEGISNTMIESLAMGIPTICTDCPVGGARMMIESGVNGLLVPVGDEDALVEAMVKVASDDGFAINLGKEAVKIKETYSMKKIADMWEKIILD